MKKFENFLLRACGYVVLILSLCYAVVGISGSTESGIPWHRFLLILAYGLLISGCDTLFSALNFHKALKVAIHYIVLLSGFMVIFALAGNATNNATRIFVAVVIFTFLYALIWLLTLGIRKLIFKVDIKIDSASTKPKKTKQKYHPIYSDDPKADD